MGAEQTKRHKLGSCCSSPSSGGLVYDGSSEVGKRETDSRHIFKVESIGINDRLNISCDDEEDILMMKKVFYLRIMMH